MTTNTLVKSAFWTCAAAVLILSLVPTAPELPSTGWDKGNHFLGFGVLAVLGRLAYPRRGIALFVGLLAFGALIEGLQSLTTYRLAEWADWIADGIGVLVGYAAMPAVRRPFPAAPPLDAPGAEQALARRQQP